MTQTTRTAPPNSLIFISDLKGGAPPLPVWGAHILATDSCISIGCYPSIDGETEITLGPSAAVDQSGVLAFDGELDTPSKAVIVETSEDTTLLREDVPHTTTRIRAWTDGSTTPDRIVIRYD